MVLQYSHSQSSDPRGLVGNKLRAIFEIKGDFQKLRAIYSLLNQTPGFKLIIIEI